MAEFTPPAELKNVQPDKLVLVKGKTIIALLDAIRRVAPIAGSGLDEYGGYGGVVLSAAAGRKTACALGALRMETVDGTPHAVLAGGFVQGGGSVIHIEDTDLGVSSGLAGQHVWIEAEWTATVEDDVLWPGGDMTSASIQTGSSAPSQVIPEWDSPEGTAIIPLGHFTDDDAPVWQPSGCGDVVVGHCPGAFSYYRTSNPPEGET